MPRFNEKKYDPALESTPGFGGLQRKTGAVVLRVAGDGCPCGCATPKGGTYTTGTGQEVTLNGQFGMGHDAILRGKLIRAHMTDTPIIVVDEEGASDPTPAIDVAGQFNWREYLRNAELRRDGANRSLLKKALGSQRLVKVGRWQYTGQVVAIFEPSNGRGEELEIEYVTKQGQTKRARVPAAETAEVVR